MVERDHLAVSLREIRCFQDGSGHADIFLIHWSMVTATMMRPPTANSCQSTSTPASARPLRKVPTISAPDQRADNRAASAEQRGPSDHHRGDGVEIGVLAGKRRDGPNAPDGDPARYGADEAGDCVGGDQHPLRVDTGQPGGFRVVACSDKVPAEGGSG